jgi:hypothetical protein
MVVLMKYNGSVIVKIIGIKFEFSFVLLTELLSFPSATKTKQTSAGLHVLSQRIFTCRLYQTDCTVSAIATDNRPFVLFTILFQILYQLLAASNLN